MYRQTAKRRRAQERKNFGDVGSPLVSASYPFRLNMYKRPPQFEITLDQFEQWAIDRMKVLGEIESRLARNQTVSELETVLKPLIAKYLPLSSNNAGGTSASSSSSSSGVVDIKNKVFKFDETNEEHRRLKDHYSHFILRLAFCRSDELRQRFIHAETTLFKIRYNTDDSDDRRAFIDSLNLAWEPVSADEVSRLYDKLAAASGIKSVQPVAVSSSSSSLSSTNPQPQFFKVDFERVVDLVETRKVYIENGKAYVPVSHQQSIVVEEFVRQLEKSLIQTVRALPRLDEDDRLVPLLNHLAQGFAATSTYLQGGSGGGNGENGGGRAEGEITADMVPGLVRDHHFPLCMQTMHNALATSHHLKYEGRRQYGLFLKYIGLSVEEAVVFWRSQFSAISEDKFNKEYRYNVRHQYGMEGSRINYKPISCIEISTTLPARGDAHGCPYRSFSTVNLVAALQQMGITDKQELAKIRSNVDASKYLIACTRVYELTHKADKTVYVDTITHPNQYFDRSYALVRDSKNEKKG